LANRGIVQQRSAIQEADVLSINNFIETEPLERNRGRKPQKNPTAENHREKEEIEIL
jgi:hypothetical protein